MKSSWRNFIFYTATLLVTPVLAQESADGFLTQRWGDPVEGVAQAGTIVFELVHIDGTRRTLQISEKVLQAAGGISSVDRQWVTVEISPQRTPLQAGGKIVSWLQRDFSITSADQMFIAQPAVSGSKRFITLPCKFSDVGDEPENQNYFNTQYGNNSGELNHFWKSESYNIVNIDGSYSEDWRELPNNRSEYIPLDEGCATTDTADLSKLFNECVAVHDSSVDFSAYFGINLAFNDELDGCAWGGGEWATLDGETKVWGVTWLPPFGYRNNQVIEHEIGHSFGLPHSNNWDNDGDPYDNTWDYMSDGFLVGPSGDYGEWGTGGLAYHKEMLGWIASAEISTVTEGVHTVELAPVAAATAESPRMIKLPIDRDGNGEYDDNLFWVVEAREKAGDYDVGIPDTAVLIYEVDQNGRIDPVWVYDDADPPADYNNNEDTMWRVGETFVDGANSLSVEVLESIASGGFRVRVTRPGGCAPALLELSNQTVTRVETYSACAITAGGNYEVQGPGGALTLNAATVGLRAGFRVTSGGTLSIGS